MILSTLSPYELGELKTSEAVEYLIIFLVKGTDNEKRLAASAIKKLIEDGTNCDTALPFLIQNLSSKKPQLRQYTLKTLSLFRLDDTFKEHLYNCYVNEDKDYNVKLLKDILVTLPNHNEIELANYSVMHNIKSQIKKEKEENRGYIYFLQEDFSNSIKIGKTKNIKERLNNFGVKLPFDVRLIHLIESENISYTEKLFHIHFQDKRINGEWFNLSKEDVDWIHKGNYTKKINLSIGNPNKELDYKKNTITDKQYEYLIFLLEKYNYPINFPLRTLSSSEASELINLITSEKTKEAIE